MPRSIGPGRDRAIAETCAPRLPAVDVTPHHHVAVDFASPRMLASAIRLPTHAWYGDRAVELLLPAPWQVEECGMAGHGGPTLDDDQLCAQLGAPFSTPPLREVAQGRKQAVILFDDLTRPAPTWRILPMVLAELHAAGFTEDRIRFVGAFANHAVMSHEDFVKKLGADVVRRYRVYNHNPFDHLVKVGTTSRGTHVEINREVMACDLRIGIGGLIPHLAAGFGGGAKLVVPGVAGIATVDHNHRVLGRRSAAARSAGPARLLGNVDDSVVHQDLEEAVSMVGLDFKVDLLINQRREVVQVFAGQFMEQHRAGVAAAKRLYTTPLASECDVVVVNTYPIENQAAKGIWPADLSLKEGGVAVVVSESVEGQAPHYLVGRFGSDYGGAIWSPVKESPIRKASRVLVCSRYQSRVDLDVYGPGGHVVPCRDWSQVLIHLTQRYPHGAKTAVYPYAAIQLPG